ncbi:MAG: hypothetical protein IJD46_02620 [Bacilli bacterium]|nr:hypothetical protein [Bacilli bacterium]
MKKKNLLVLAVGTLFALCSCGNNSSESSSLQPSVPSLKEFTVTWIVDGNTSKETYTENETPSYKYGTEKDADAMYTYTFVGWDKELAPVVEDVTYEAVYESEYVNYSIKWVVDGKETVETYHYTDTPTFKGTPTKASSAQYSYTFTGWTPEITDVTADATYTALFEETINEYEVTWIVDGVETKDTYAYGEMPVYDGELVKEADAQYTYTFSGWDKEIAQVTQDVTYTAVFDGAVNTYEIKWIVGGEEFTENYEYGQTPTFKGSTDRESDQYNYLFTGWDKEVLSVTGNQTYVAQYTQSIRQYDVKFYNEDGTLLTTLQVEYDAVPVYSGETPTKVSTEENFHYEFVGWTNKATEMTYPAELPVVLGAVEYYAVYERVGNPTQLTYNLLNLDGSLIQTGTVEYPIESVYTFTAPVVEGKVANTDYVKGFVLEENEPIVIYYSELDEYDGTSISTSFLGEGTEENPFLISSGADLALLRDKVNAGEVYTGVYFKLTKSIDLNDVENFMIGLNGIDPSAISETNPRLAFDGYLDGNNCSIRGVNVNKTTPFSGLFAALNDNGTLINLSVYGSVNAGQYTGGIVGRSFGKLINLNNYVSVTQSGANGSGGVAGGTTSKSLTDGCVNYGKVENITGNNKTGGITGLGEGVLRNCINFGEVIGNQFVAGIVGESLVAQSLVENCVNYGNISFKQSGAGVIGQSSATTVSNLVNRGNIKSEATSDGGSYFSGGVIGCVKTGVSGTYTNLINYGDLDVCSRAGGIAGEVDTKKTFVTTFVNCINYGTISSSHKNAYSGGTFGAVGNANLQNCENYGEVIAVGKFVGGIAGVVITDGSLTITGCKNHADVSSLDNGVAGILGGPVNASKSDMNISGCVNNGTVTGGNKVAGILGFTGDKGVIADDNVNNGKVVATADNAATGDIIGDDVRKN